MFKLTKVALQGALCTAHIHLRNMCNRFWAKTKFDGSCTFRWISHFYSCINVKNKIQIHALPSEYNVHEFDLRIESVTIYLKKRIFIRFNFSSNRCFDNIWFSPDPLVWAWYIGWTLYCFSLLCVVTSISMVGQSAKIKVNINKTRIQEQQHQPIKIKIPSVNKSNIYNQSIIRWYQIWYFRILYLFIYACLWYTTIPYFYVTALVTVMIYISLVYIWNVELRSSSFHPALLRFMRRCCCLFYSIPHIYQILFNFILERDQRKINQKNDSRNEDFFFCRKELDELISEEFIDCKWWQDVADIFIIRISNQKDCWKKRRIKPNLNTHTHTHSRKIMKI